MHTHTDTCSCAHRLSVDFQLFFRKEFSFLAKMLVTAEMLPIFMKISSVIDSGVI